MLFISHRAVTTTCIRNMHFFVIFNLSARPSFNRYKKQHLGVVCEWRYLTALLSPSLLVRIDSLICVRLICLSTEERFCQFAKSHWFRFCLVTMSDVHMTADSRRVQPRYAKSPESCNTCVEIPNNLVQFAEPCSRTDRNCTDENLFVCTICLAVVNLVIMLREWWSELVYIS